MVNVVAADDVEAAADDVAVPAAAEELDCGRTIKVAKISYCWPVAPDVAVKRTISTVPAKFAGAVTMTV